MSADCKHFSVRVQGELRCRHCGWVFRFGMAGSRWVDPKEKPIDA